MATCNVTLDLAYGGDQPYTSGSMWVGRAVPADSTTGYVDGSLEAVPLANPPTVLGEGGFQPLEQTKIYLFVGPTGIRYYKLIPATATADFSDLVDAVPVDPPEGYAAKLDAPSLAGETLIVQGDSLTDPAAMVPGQTPTVEGMYANRVAAALGGNAPISYGKAGTRVGFGVSSVLSAGTWTGLPAPVAGAVWPGAASRPGPVIVDFLMNDYAHTNGTTIYPQPITGAGGTRYANAVAAAYEALLAIVSSETRREISSGVTGVTLTGAGAASYAAAYLSGGDFTWLTASGDRVDLTNVLPPQTGPLAGRVYLSVDSFDPGVLANADATVAIDGGTAVPWTNPGWEAYGGVDQSYSVIPVELPTDTAGHAVRANWAGAGYLGLDALLVMSETPPDIYVMDTYDPIPNAGVWSAADVAVWKANRDILRPLIRAAVAKFPNAIWVPCTMTPGPLWVDGIHPNDAGLAQRAEDLKSAIVTRELLGLPAAKRLLAA